MVCGVLTLGLTPLFLKTKCWLHQGNTLFIVSIGFSQTVAMSFGLATLFLREGIDKLQIEDKNCGLHSKARFVV